MVPSTSLFGRPQTLAPVERRLSIRLIWPFVRIAGGDEQEMELLTRDGIGLAELADPETRLRHSLVMELLEHVVRRSGDPAVGLRAAQAVEPVDLDVLEHVVRTAPNLREAISSYARYAALLNEATEVTIEEAGDVATVTMRVTDGVPQHPAANDFMVACVLGLARRHSGVHDLQTEIRLTHSEVTSASEYARVFGSRVVLGARDNAIVMRRASLDLPMLRADRSLRAAFELHAQSLLDKVRKDDGIKVRVREILLAQLASGDTSMELVARKLAMSVATLRRRLEDEGTSHREILDQTRHQLAIRYLRDRRLATSEVAFLLGFSHVTALHKAFKRWTGGATPAAFRARGTQPEAGQARAD